MSRPTHCLLSFPVSRRSFLARMAGPALVAGTLLAALLVAPLHARANDSSAVLGAGGLELTTSSDIVMEKEDLYLSPEKVQVTYLFRNESDRNITTRVAFPLPLIDQSAFTNVSLPVPGDENFVDFHIRVNGQEIHPHLELRAFTQDGRDVTAQLTASGVPLNSYLPDFEERLRAVPDRIWRNLAAEGLLDTGAGDFLRRTDDVSPNWNLQAVFYWEQTFPAGQIIQVEHSYRPIVGTSLMLKGDHRMEEFSAYCLDAQGRAGLEQLLRRRQNNPDPDAPRELPVREVAYVLTTGANWKGPIGAFHLTIDKGAPGAILSLCMDGLTKTGPTTFELSRENFIPKKDIRFVIFGD
ncbi:DUF4424 domain-containing protein [Xanthobacter sp. TB0139]|uniref:DUF4424 domain-containing protein n=1 Tax=Xanthobacter sp. TB0139 TaxID=3459178 RepID=UPI0040390812